MSVGIENLTVLTYEPEHQMPSIDAVALEVLIGTLQWEYKKRYRSLILCVVQELILTCKLWKLYITLVVSKPICSVDTVDDGNSRNEPRSRGKLFPDEIKTLRSTNHILVLGTVSARSRSCNGQCGCATDSDSKVYRNSDCRGLNLKVIGHVHMIFPESLDLVMFRQNVSSYAFWRGILCNIGPQGRFATSPPANAPQQPRLYCQFRSLVLTHLSEADGVKRLVLKAAVRRRSPSGNGGDLRALTSRHHRSLSLSWGARDFALPENHSRLNYLESFSLPSSPESPPFEPRWRFATAEFVFGEGSKKALGLEIGHADGHINIPACTSTDGTWILLGGDLAHHLDMITGNMQVVYSVDANTGAVTCGHEDKEVTENIRRMRSSSEIPRF
ncbi:uncharacterized protein EDB91DRAFT_1339631 [Suillus paluster]|uniref:uncharacterized protein n=1 Tax=Suillus paluster TaxID=48578 RepID=UPI001B871F07|nr:uncharacterized protein EDB91DRAFT_1339631 [Suillus paluster]KAG1726536.1 hypothetical protein EDB91DRAFT_1339631 [Suillus paluster]